MNIIELDSVLNTLKSENNPADLDLIRFYEAKRVELVNRIHEGLIQAAAKLKEGTYR